MKLILLTGPSGAGKDTLLRGARAHFAADRRIGFLRRYITRPPDRNEDNYYVEANGFEILEAAGFFISTWRSHHQRYGLPDPAAMLPGCEAVLCSVSRTAVIELEDRYPDTTTILLRVGGPVLAARLRARRREDEASIRQRLERSQLGLQARNLVELDNSDSPDEGIRRFTGLLEQLLEQRRPEATDAPSGRDTVEVGQ